MGQEILGEQSAAVGNVMREDPPLSNAAEPPLRKSRRKSIASRSLSQISEESKLAISSENMSERA